MEMAVFQDTQPNRYSTGTEEVHKINFEWNVTIVESADILQPLVDFVKVTNVTISYGEQGHIQICVWEAKSRPQENEEDDSSI